MSLHGKCTEMVICAVHFKTMQRYNNSSPYVTVKMAAAAIALDIGQKETWVLF